MSAGERAKSGRVVPAGRSYAGEQGLDYTPGVSAQTVGSAGLWVGTVVIPPGGRTRAHVHDHHESAFFLAVARPGDYLYIPPGVPHVAVNRSQDTPAVFVGARTDPNEQESVVMRPGLDARVP